MARQPQFVCEGIVDSKSPAPNMPDPDDIFSSGEIPWPDARPLNVYAFDPSIGKFVGNYMTSNFRPGRLARGSLSSTTTPPPGPITHPSTSTTRNC
jgi:hypothetical protein